jgi:TetR/AcrR family fatty acid metabolism transcriptional regulator
LAQRAAAVEEKRRQILDAAVRVFAQRGFHTSRVGDIAEEAGVAHGLLYHYFDSKDQLLETVFHENWSVLLDRIRAVEQTDEPAVEQLRHVALIILRTWKHQPDVVRVVVREIARSPEIQQQIGELVQPIDSLRRIFERGQELGEFRRELDPGLCASIFYGGIDAVLTGWVLGTRPDGDAALEEAERTLLGVVVDGFRAVGAVAPGLGAEQPAEA